ncbi:MAG: SDR family oxidoreductase [Pirellulaceae bacterium]|nr:SDR family oxidoreductase [Pirellulaceae bacterium]
MSSQLFDLSDQVAMVSGSAQGMGKHMLLALAQQGANAVVVDLNIEAAQNTAAEIEALGRQALAVQCDVSDVDQIRDLYRQIDDKFGRIDFVGNVAGHSIRQKPEDIPLEEVEAAWRSLVYGRFCSCQEAGRRMIQQGKGSIVNIGSLASVTALGRGHIAYSMAMGAVVAMTRELSTEWSGRGVRVNCILPAQTLNPNLKSRMASDPRLKDRYLSGLPVGRFGDPTDIQGLSVFLASDAASFITGALIPMDGGNLAMNAGGSVGSEVFNE